MAPSTTTVPAGWTEVYRALCRDMERGTLPPGSDLPTIAALAQQSGLSPYGARRVMERLRQEGRAQSWQGKGYRVAMPLIRLRIADRSPVFGDNIRSLGFTASSSLMGAKTVGLPDKIARRMGRRTGARARLTETLRRVNERPVALSLDYFSPRQLDGIDQSLSTTGSVSKSLRAHGIAEYRRDFTELSCRAPTAHEALMLDIPRTQPVYVTLGGNLDAQGAVFQVSKAIWRADCVTYEF